MYKLSYYNFYFQITDDVHLLYNSLSNGLCEVNKEQFDNIKSLGESSFSQNTLSFFDEEERHILQRNGIVVKTDVDEKDLIRHLLSVAKQRNREVGTLSVVLLPTNACNMRCPYCFEGNKPDEHGFRMMDESVVDQVINVFQKAIDEAEEKKYENLFVEWYGGEPLMAPDLIDRFSKKLIGFAEKNGLGYDGKMITNGTLLTKEIWEMLLENKITDVQITLDGDDSVHNNKRLLCNNDKSYHRILKNMQCAPDGIVVPLRINADRDVVPTLDKLFDDLYAYGIWPHRYKWVQPYLAHKEYYKGGSTEDEDLYYTFKDYYGVGEDLRRSMVDRFNKWANESGVDKTARKSKKYPRREPQTCMLTDLPTGFVVDADGYIHKCMCPVNEHQDRMGHISDFDYSLQDKWLNFDKMSVEQCAKCKILPICKETCTHRFIMGSPRCSELKFFLKDIITEYYYENFTDDEGRDN